MPSALLIPIYEPSGRVLPFLKQFKEGDFDAFLVVDDGSGEAYRDIFDAIREQTAFEVLSYPKNGGKGHALKEGMKKLIAEHADLERIVTADGDGQHAIEDILKVKSASIENPNSLVLGVRDFANAPKASKSGNFWSSLYFKAATRIKLSDTQTGLRAIPKASFDMALATYGERFDYEFNYLLPASREFGLVQVPIQTIYEDNNSGSHFRGFKDTMLIMRTPLVYIFIGVTSFLIDIVSFALFSKYVFTVADTSALELLYCEMSARALSFPYNYLLLEFLVFHHKKGFHNSFYKYFIIAVLSMFASYGMTLALRTFGQGLIVLKILIDAFLGIVKYFINLMVTFANRRFKKH